MTLAVHIHITPNSQLPETDFPKTLAVSEAIAPHIAVGDQVQLSGSAAWLTVIGRQWVLAADQQLHLWLEMRKD